MEEPGVGVENLHLFLASFHNMRMAVPYMGNIVDAVKILGTQTINLNFYMY